MKTTAGVKTRRNPLNKEWKIALTYNICIEQQYESIQVLNHEGKRFMLMLPACLRAGGLEYVVVWEKIRVENTAGVQVVLLVGWSSLLWRNTFYPLFAIFSTH